MQYAFPEDLTIEEGRAAPAAALWRLPLYAMPLLGERFGVAVVRAVADPVVDGAPRRTNP